MMIMVIVVNTMFLESVMLCSTNMDITDNLFFIALLLLFASSVTPLSLLQTGR